MKVNFIDFQTWSLHNMNNYMFSILNSDLTFLIADNKISEFEEYGLVALINRELNYIDTNVECDICLSECKYNYNYYRIDIRDYFDALNNYRYNLTIEDLEYLNSINMFDKLENNKKIICISVKNKSYRTDLPLYKRLFTRRRLNTYNYLDYRF